MGIIVDKDSNQIDASTVSSKPSDRHFRDAWAISDKVISEDITKAKNDETQTFNFRIGTSF